MAPTINIDQQALMGPGPDVQVVAKQIVTEKRRLKKFAPTQADLATAITDIAYNDTMYGSSELKINVSDPDWVLCDSGFFDADDNGLLDKIDLNYPAGSRFWWRLMSVDFGPAGSRDLNFMERAAVYLMQHHDREKASRAKKTRAEFLLMLASRVKAGGGIEFICKELHTKQKVENEKVERKSSSDRRRLKDGGINPNVKVKIKGKDADKAQLREVERVLDVAVTLQAPLLAVSAALVAGIQESLFRTTAKDYETGTHRGVFQSNQIAQNDTEEQARCFFKGGRGFGAGGAIALANANPGMTPGEIATKVEVSGEPGAVYDKWRTEADKLLDAYGGGTFGGTSYVKQFNFEVGSVDDPYEDYWEAMNRLAEDVGWPLFLDGNRLYFDSEMTLIGQKPVAVVRRGDPWVTDPVGTWDNREIATEITIELMCNPFEFRAGEVFQLEGFGPFSKGSTATPRPLPGRWLIKEIEPTGVPFVQSFTLKQPEKPKREPRSESAERRDISQVGGPVEGDAKNIIDKVVLPIASESGVRLTPLQVEQANARHSHLGEASDHAGPGSTKWAVDVGIGPDIRGGSNAAGAAKGDAIAKAIAAKFGIPWTGSGLKSVTKGPYRFQLIWRYEDPQAGNHYTHVHFGVKVVGPLDGSKDPTQREIDAAMKEANR